MKRILYCALLSLLAACLLAACDGFSLNSFSGQGAPCHSDKTCKSPLACIAGTCQPPGTDGDTQDSDLDTNEKDADEQSEQAEQIEQDGEPDSEAELPSDGDREGESEPLEDVTGPTITVTAPQGGTYAVTTKLSIQWTAGDSQSGIRDTDGFAIDLYQGSCGLGTTGSVAHIATLNGDMRGFDWTIPSGVPENGDYYIKVAAIDNALNWGFACSSRIAVSNPADGDLEMESDAEKEPDPDPDPDSADGDSAESEHDTTDGDSESEIEVPLTWLDTASGLTWQVTPPVDPLDHAAASMSCDTLDLGSYTDWRLPSISELRSLVRDCEKMQIGGACGVTDGCTTSTCLGSSCQGCSGSAPNGCYWPTASVLGACDWFWASTLNVEDQSQAWMIGFGNAYIGTDQMTKTHRLRCVRGTANWPVDGDLDTTDNDTTDNDTTDNDTACVDGPCCSGGVPVAAGKPCLSGADSFSCTDDLCDAAGACTHPIKENVCLIKGVCYDWNQDNPANACEYCLGNINPTEWIKKSKGTVCDDKDDCTYYDQCDTGVCSGTYISCVSDSGPCGVIRSCNGTKNCTEIYPDSTVACNDLNSCSANDSCNGLGACVGTPYTCDEPQPGLCEITNVQGCNGDGTCTYQYIANTGGSCDDQNACTYGDTCTATKACLGTVYSCNDHGSCDGFGGCKCDPAYTGNNCTQCADGAFGNYPDCFMPNFDYCQSNDCFRVPSTNQSSCYTDSVVTSCIGSPGTDVCGNTLYCGQDAQYDTGSRNFVCFDATGSLLAPCPSTVTSGEMVKDPVTGLLWQRAITPGLTWDQAKVGCAGTSYGGYADWRLPSPQELQSLNDESGLVNNPSDRAFPSQLGKYFWSAIEKSNDSSVAWLSSGFVGAYPKTSSGTLRCVRGGPKSATVGSGSSSARFVQHTGAGVSGDLVVYDLVTGLIWQSSAAISDSLNWGQAIAACESSSFGGYKDWRLPNKKELLSLTNYARSYPASSFPNLNGYKRFWSSTSVPNTPGSAWMESFLDGNVAMDQKTALYSTLCVRGGAMTFMPVKAGTFTMGSPESELGRYTNANETQHQVTLTYDFEMAAHETTQAEWAAFAKNPSWFGPNGMGTISGPNAPVERVNWFEALEYANWLSSLKGLPTCYLLSGCTGTIGGGCPANNTSCSGGTYTCTSVTLNGIGKPQDCQGYRLPTEAEWEFAARAGTTTATYSGNLTATDCANDPALTLIEWYCGNSGNTTHPVGLKSPNAWGLYDMLGNVWEWGWDSIDGTDYSAGSVTDPVEQNTGLSRSTRGGCWESGLQGARSANRGSYSLDYRRSIFGFRLVRTTNPPTSGFTKIKAGTFTMGSPASDQGRNIDETQHQVTLTYDFEMATHETTQGEFQNVSGYNPSNFSACGANCPVENVSWHEALAYANLLSTQKGFAQCYECTGATTAVVCSLKSQYAKPQDCPGFRLPTDAEWEYAARAGSTTSIYTSSNNDGSITQSSTCSKLDPNLDLIAWYCGNDNTTTKPAFGKAPNAWGLYDMAGNVWEWTWDWFDNLPSDAVNDPTGASTGTYRVGRGGSYRSYAYDNRSASRNADAPDSRSINEGFRLVRTTNPPTSGFTKIKAGTFMMGSPANELGRYANETQHQVTLTYDFEMQTTLVTQAEFTAFAGTNPSYFSASGGGTACGTNCPVERVNWYEAVTYANWLSSQNGLTPCYLLTACIGTLGDGCASGTTGCTSGAYTCTVALNKVSKPQDCTGFRLPTEAEWEYAARAGTTTATYNGNLTYTGTGCTSDSTLAPIAWYCYNAGSTTHPVRVKTPNAWGLYDILGNVYEWGWDWVDGSDYDTGSVTDATGQSTGSLRVARGGRWHSEALGVRSANRFRAGPGYRYYDFGFRLVRTISP